MENWSEGWGDATVGGTSELGDDHSVGAGLAGSAHSGDEGSVDAEFGVVIVVLVEHVAAHSAGTSHGAWVLATVFGATVAGEGQSDLASKVVVVFADTGEELLWEGEGGGEIRGAVGIDLI